MKVDTDRLKGDRILKLICSLEGEKFYLVGGCVRDLLLNKPLKDIDIVVERLSYGFLKNFSLAFGAQKLIKSQFLTIKVRAGKRTFDIARTRSEYYEAPGKLPKVYPVYDIVMDLKRRDFTINSMAIEFWPRTFRLIDPLGGFEDLKAGVLRVNKRGSFFDDPTRAFRAIRYRHRFKLKYDDTTELEFQHLHKSLPNVSFTRIKNEVARIVCEEKRFLMFREIGERGLFKIWDDSFSSFDLSLLEKFDKALSKTEDKWFYFLIPFGLEDYFRKYPYNFKVGERRVLGLLFNPVKLPPLPRFSELHSILKDFDAEAGRVWSILKGITPEVLESYLARRELLRHSISLNVLVRKLGNPQKARKAYNLITSALLDGKIQLGEEEDFLKKILPAL